MAFGEKHYCMNCGSVMSFPIGLCSLGCYKTYIMAHPEYAEKRKKRLEEHKAMLDAMDDDSVKRDIKKRQDAVHKDQLDEIHKAHAERVASVSTQVNVVLTEDEKKELTEMVQEEE